MKSFKRSLIIRFVGVIFINFLLIYSLFNFFVNEFIEAEAERDFNNIGYNIFPEHSEGYSSLSIYMSSTNEENILYQNELINSNQNILDEYTSIDRNSIKILNIEYADTSNHFEYNNDFILVDELNNILLVVEHLSFHGVSISSQSGILSIFNNYGNDIILFNNLDKYASEKHYLLSYYKNNISSFNNGEIVKLTYNNKTFYLKLLKPMYNSSIAVLAYSDITHVTHFVNRINTILIYILILSGIITIFIGVKISSKFEKLLLQLSNFAKDIGIGNFSNKLSPFKYKEFNMLSESMNKMSNMLYNYENKQKQFFQNVSHELRTPLMSIQGYAEGILEDVVDKTEGSQIIVEESQEMTKLITQLLYISRLDSEIENLSLAPANLEDIINKCNKELQIIAKNFNKEIIIYSSKKIILKVDEQKLTRAIINIMSNCIRYASKKVNIKYYKLNSNLKIIISDDGKGIDEKDIPFIFDRFYKGKNGNIGLGLSISKDIVNAHNGTIEASNSNSGAIFVITLPI